jgi:5'-3' exonuclease
MLLKLLREEQPDYIACVFESREKTFRHETFADYKKNRLEMPEDLASQHRGDQFAGLRSRRRDRRACQQSR